MDVIWTAEFAEAEWILPWPEDVRRPGRARARCGAARDRDLQGQALRRAGELQHAAALVPQGPRRPAAEDLGRADRHGRRSCPRPGGSRSRAPPTRATRCGSTRSCSPPAAQILRGADQVALGPARRARRRDHLASSPTPRPPTRRSSTQKEDQNRLAFESGDAAFQVNYPFIYPSAKEGNPAVFKQIALGAVPAGRRRQARQGADRRLQLGRRAATRSTPRRPSRRPRACATSRASAVRQARRPAADAGGRLRRPEVQEDLPVRGPDPEPARQRRRAARRARPTPTCRSGSTRRCGRRRASTRGRRSTSCATRSSRRSTRGPCYEHATRLDADDGAASRSGAGL